MPPPDLKKVDTLIASGAPVSVAFRQAIRESAKAPSSASSAAPPTTTPRSPISSTPRVH
jgi:hypothetical protein